jgi:hypothetical protein
MTVIQATQPFANRRGVIGLPSFINTARTAHIVIDLQQAYAVDEPLEVPDAWAIVPRVNQITAA